jgi:hypothetical protein
MARGREQRRLAGVLDAERGTILETEEASMEVEDVCVVRLQELLPATSILAESSGMKRPEAR